MNFSKKSKTFTRKLSSITTMQLPSLPSSKQEELLHFRHPQHLLELVNFPDLFTCVGCKEYGAGRRYRCQECDFELHDFCALAPPSLHNHPLHSHSQLVFYAKPSGFLRSSCGVCSKTIKGFAFRCKSCTFEMHPCCSKLLYELDYPAHPHTLMLATPTATPTREGNFVCSSCMRKRAGWVYRCLGCSYHLHAVCAKDVINGLYTYGIRIPPKTNMLGAAARFASQAVLGFVGGMLEGIGEGVGETLIENIGKGMASNAQKHMTDEEDHGNMT